MRRFYGLCFFLSLSVLAFGQPQSTLIRGTTVVGSVNAVLTNAVKIEAVQTTYRSDGRKDYGINLRLKPSASAYIAYEDIDDAINSLSYLNIVDKSVTKLDTYEVSVVITEFLHLTAYNTENGNAFLLIAVGAPLSATTASIRRADIAQLSDLLAKAKQKLDSIR